MAPAKKVSGNLDLVFFINGIAKDCLNNEIEENEKHEIIY